jgi:DNA (cytosine-5)-methyltransferase 1
VKTVQAADLFCGAGGASSALRAVCESLGVELDLLAVNHWPRAVETHSRNHPQARHMCQAVEQINPREAVPGGRLHVLLAGPSCVHFSRARGGKPVSEQARASAWCVLRWLTELHVDTLLVENVEEFREWGPLGVDGRPLSGKRGQLYQSWLAAIRAAGYTVADQVLNAADYGDATTRRRLFVVARRDRRPISWPVPTHSRTGQRTLHGSTERWVAARSVIDWSIPGKSIFGRDKPLSRNTLGRILSGLERFGGPGIQPFLVVLRQHMGGRSLDRPLPTIAAAGQHIGLCEPVLMHVTHGGRPRSVNDPLPTITGANRGELAVCQPFILQQQSGGAPRTVDSPLPTVASRGAQALVEPCLIPFYGERFGQTPRAHSIGDPVPTIPASGSGKFGLVEPIISGYYSGGSAAPVSSPLPTITTKDRFALVQPVIDEQLLDIRFRMLKPHELAAAMSFGSGYQFAGTLEEQVRQIGNAWPVKLGQALIGELLAHHARRQAA